MSNKRGEKEMKRLSNITEGWGAMIRRDITSDMREEDTIDVDELDVEGFFRYLKKYYESTGKQDISIDFPDSKYTDIIIPLTNNFRLTLHTHNPTRINSLIMMTNKCTRVDVHYMKYILYEIGREEGFDVTEDSVKFIFNYKDRYNFPIKYSDLIEWTDAIIGKLNEPMIKKR